MAFPAPITSQQLAVLDGLASSLGIEHRFSASSGNCQSDVNDWIGYAVSDATNSAALRALRQSVKATIGSNVTPDAKRLFEYYYELMNSPLPLSFWDGGGYWFDLPTSLTSSTASARSLTPVASPATVSPAMGGNAAIQFNGSTQYYSCNSLASLFATGGPFTVATRGRPTNGGYLTVWGAGYGFTGAAVCGQIANEFPTLLSQDGAGGNVVRTATTRTRFEDSVILWSYDGAGTSKIYIDGVLDSITSSTTAIPTAFVDTFSLGCWFSANTVQQPFPGFIKRFAVASQTITAAQAAALAYAWGQSTDYTLSLANSPRYLWLGDSITQGDSGHLAAGYRYNLQNYNIANRYSLAAIGQYKQGAIPNNRHSGLSGSDLLTIQNLCTTGLNGQSARMILFMGGSNNMSQGSYTLALTAYDTCLRSIYAQNRALLGTDNFVITVSTIPDQKNVQLGWSQIAPFNAGLPALWNAFEADHPGILRRWDAYAILGTWGATYFGTDPAHPNDAGYDRLFTLGLLPAISADLAAMSPT